MSKAEPKPEAAQCPPEQVTLVYRQQDGAHSFDLEIPGLVVLDHDLSALFAPVQKARRFRKFCLRGSFVEYQADMSFGDFKAKIVLQEERRTASMW